MAFKPGESGNPNGRAKGSQNKATSEVKALALKHVPDAIKELARIASSSENDSARVSAIREILDRAAGKSAQAIGGTDDLPPIVAKIIHEYVRPES